MARQVTSELGGLPIAMSKAAKTLINKLKVTCLQQKSNSNSNSTFFENEKEKENSNSNFFKKEKRKPKSNDVAEPTKTEAELFVLVCSLFPRNFSVPIEDLVNYGMGLDLFNNVHNSSEARSRVLSLIEIINLVVTPPNTLKLRLEEDKYNNQFVKVESRAYSIASSIASKHQLVFWQHETVSEKWPNIDRYKDCYGLPLVLRKINEHPMKLECPRIALFLLKYRQDSKSLPIGFFGGMKELRVLSLDVALLSHSLNLPRNLRMLCLKVLKLEDMSWIGNLINLQYLSISTVFLADIPREMGELCNLRLLDLRKTSIAYLPPGVFSRLLKLEELYMPLSFTRWGCLTKEHDGYDELKSKEEDDFDEEEGINKKRSEIDDGDRINARLSEIEFLPLHALQISIRDVSVLPKRSQLFKNIYQFKILVSDNLKYRPFGKGLVNELHLTGDACDIQESGIYYLMSRAEDLNFTKVRNMRRLKYYNFAHLKNMIISESDELEYIVSTTANYIPYPSRIHLSMLPNLKEIWHGTRPQGRWFNGLREIWFNGLREINIRFCHKLKYVCPWSIATELRVLSSIEILDCNEVKGIFYHDEVDNVEVSFITNLHLHSLPKLVGVVIQNDEVDNEKQSSEDEAINQSLSRGKLQKSVTQQLISNNQVSRIRDKDINGRMKKYYGFSFQWMEKRLKKLEKLKIAFCDEIRVIFLFKEDHANTTVLTSLKELELYGLRNLTHIWFQVPRKVKAFQKLQVLILSECNNLYVLSPRVAQLLVQLQKLQISRCEMMDEVIAKEDIEEIDPTMSTIVFPLLKALELQHMPKLNIFYGGIYAIELPLLEYLKLNQCNKMKSFCSGSSSTPMLKKVQMNGSLYSVVGDLNATMNRTKTQMILPSKVHN